MAPQPTAPTPDQRDDSSATLAAAHAYAARGWAVFPLRPGQKAPAVKAWQTQASTDPDVIEWWWTDRRDCGIGIACGPSRLVVVDLDHKPAQGITWRTGWNTLAAAGPLPRTLTVRTPSGGWHLYYAAPDPTDGPVLRNTASKLAPGIDTRAAGGYVAAPPTRLPHGIYTATADPTGASGTVAALPGWLAERLITTPEPVAAAGAVHLSAGRGRAGAYLAAALRREADKVTAAPEGTRNHALYLAAIALGQLVAGGAVGEDDVRAVLTSACAGHVTAGAFGWAEAEATIRSGLRAGARRPRSLAAVDAA